MVELTRSRQRMQNAEDIRDGLVRQSGTNMQSNYNSGRTYAMATATEKFADGTSVESESHIFYFLPWISTSTKSHRRREHANFLVRLHVWVVQS